MYCFIFSYYKLYIFLFILTMKGNAMFLHIVGMIVFSKLLRTKIVYLNRFVQHIWKQYWGWRYRKNKHSWRFKDMYIWFDKHHYFMINSWSLPKVLNTSLIYHAWIEVTMFIREMYVQIYLFSFVTLSKEKKCKTIIGVNDNQTLRWFLKGENIYVSTWSEVHAHVLIENHWFVY